MRELRAATARLQPGDGLLSYISIDALDPLLRATFKVTCERAHVPVDASINRIGVIATYCTDPDCDDFNLEFGVDRMFQLHAGGETFNFAVDPQDDTEFLSALFGASAVIWLNCNKMSVQPLADPALKSFAQIALGEQIQRMVASICGFLVTGNYLVAHIGPSTGDDDHDQYYRLQIGKVYDATMSEMKDFLRGRYFPEGTIFFAKRGREKIDVLVTEEKAFHKPSVFDILHIIDIPRISRIAEARYEKMPAV